MQSDDSSIVPPNYFDMVFQIPPFFVALIPDVNGHCEIDDSYYTYYENTLDDYYSCLSGANKTPPITKENIKHTVVNYAKNILIFVNRTLQRLRVGNEDNHLPTYIRKEATMTSCSNKEDNVKGYSLRIAVSFPCPIEN